MVKESKVFLMEIYFKETIGLENLMVKESISGKTKLSTKDNSLKDTDMEKVL